MELEVSRATEDMIVQYHAHAQSEHERYHAQSEGEGYHAQYRGEGS
jgi:hypothetical protein